MAQVATDRFTREIRKSHQVLSYVDVIGPNQQTIRLPATDGSVKVDKSAGTRRSCTIKCIDPLGQLTPKNTASILTPYGTEIKPYRGIVYDDGTKEVYPLGVFRLSKTSVADNVGGSPDISIEGFDRSRTISRSKFTNIYTVASGANVIDAIKAIVTLTFPDVTFDSITSSLATTAPQVYDISSDPWDAVTSLGVSVGCDVFFDAMGVCVIAPPPDIAALPSPVFTYIENQGCTMIDLSRIFTDEPGFNGVIVTGESPGDELPAVRGEAWDMEPSSPTYRLGPYGQVPMFVTDQILKTQADCEVAAQSLLNAQLGFSSQLSITAQVNPSFECGDVVRVERARSNVTGLYLIDSFDVPLMASSTQQLTLRQNRSVG